jgi:diguanylate cyclase (GGDEF)-like protein
MVVNDYRITFDLDVVSLVLIDDGDELRDILGNEGLELEQLPELKLLPQNGKLDTVYGASLHSLLSAFDASRHDFLFQDLPQTPASVALLPLVRNGELIGSMNLGSTHADRFVEGTGTDFLERIAAVVAICIENSENHERLKRLGLTDPLTRINNRRFFDQRLDEEVSDALRHKQSLSCMFLDVDKFKRVNDELGHQSGDFILQGVAMLINSQLRTSDVFARYGGEEFIVLLPNTIIEFAMEIAERIRTGIEDHAFNLPEKSNFHITISIGISSLGISTGATDHDVRGHAETLVDTADQALLTAKESGRNRVVCAAPSLAKAVGG